MSAHEPTAPTEVRIERREFLRLSSVAAAAAALASTACQVPPETSVPFHDMPENLVDGMGKARYFHTVIEGTPVLVRTREGRPILVAPRANETSGGHGGAPPGALMDAIPAARPRPAPPPSRYGHAAAMDVGLGRSGIEKLNLRREPCCSPARAGTGRGCGARRPARTADSATWYGRRSRQSIGCGVGEGFGPRVTSKAAG
jgi:hypothetical protein